MKIEFKNLKTFRGMEGYGYNANLYLDDVKVALVMDGGNGGALRYEVSNKELFDKVKTYAESLPPWEIDGHKYPMDMGIFCTKLFDEADFTNRFKAQMGKHILVGIPGSSTFGKYNCKKTLSSIDKAALQKYITDVVVKQLKPGEKILNTNLNGFKLD